MYTPDESMTLIFPFAVRCMNYLLLCDLNFHTLETKWLCLIFPFAVMFRVICCSTESLCHAKKIDLERLGLGLYFLNAVDLLCVIFCGSVLSHFSLIKYVRKNQFKIWIRGKNMDLHELHSEVHMSARVLISQSDKSLMLSDLTLS